MFIEVWKKDSCLELKVHEFPDFFLSGNSRKRTHYVSSVFIFLHFIDQKKPGNLWIFCNFLQFASRVRGNSPTVHQYFSIKKISIEKVIEKVINQSVNIINYIISFGKGTATYCLKCVCFFQRFLYDRDFVMNKLKDLWKNIWPPVQTMHLCLLL